jgi:putative ABC transport system permease protein
MEEVQRGPSLWHLAWRQLVRDFRAGELRLLVVAVTLAVAALTAVGFFADRLNHGLARDARQLLGGDAIVLADHPVPAAFSEKARELRLVTATSATFPSMARAPDEKGGATRLVGVKAVSETYPQPEELARAPERGTVWVDQALVDALGVKVGDALLLGDASLRIARVLLLEPDRDTGFTSFAPRVMLHEADLAATALIQPASRVRYRLAVASPSGNDEAVGRYTAWVEAQIKSQSLRGLRIESFASGRCARHWTAPRSFLTSSRCWRRCFAPWRWASPRATLPIAISMIARCCACWGSRSAASRCNT